MGELLFGEERNRWCSDFPKLGFGMMRLPRREDGKTIDLEQTSRMVDAFKEAGLFYFDTAWAYEGSEEAVRESLVKRYPRDSFFLVDKLNAWMVKDEKSAKEQIDISLKRAGVDYFDMYFLHSVEDGRNDELYRNYGIWDYMKELKAEGKIRHFGFSFHGSPELLDRLLTEHPDTELVQLQINYADWNNLRVQSAANLAVCQKHHMPVTVMEPVKGGLLANPPQNVATYLKKENPDASLPSWAIRFAASQKGVITVLSGMSSMEQMQDNLSYMKDFKPLDDHEKEVILHVQELMEKADHIACTRCHYCMPGCPQQIHIPDIFRAMNTYKLFGNKQHAKMEYGWAVEGTSKASDCLQCGQCEEACPQHLPIITLLKEAAQTLE